eukprot:TRINITY_DN6934_c0_g1_i4.p1 TRINITY_DN6934_c0_g1~~TRINITY_DN6934_c0_g1_i4.p1  ORF type:complete len:648 (-),score=145.99 TRINITY_DN6934_c0_g1_i4:662-2605(-)
MKMRDQLYLPEAVTARVAELLGNPVDHNEKYCQLMTSAEDHLFIWNERDQNVLAVNLSSRGEDRVQILNLTDCPLHSVTGLVSSSRGERLCAFGEDGVTAIEVPRRSGRDGRLAGGDTDILCRAVTVHRSRVGKSVQKCSWYPGSAAQNQLFVLTRDGTLSLYLVMDHGARQIHQVFLGGGDRVSTALGETVVDYCVGKPMHYEDSSIWPVFVLWGDGGIFCVTTGGLDTSWTVKGPIKVLPEQELSYSQEACSILCLGESEGPTMVCVARVDGTILHHLVLGHPNTGELTLYLYEKVELEMGPLDSSESESVFSCPVSLVPDLSSRTRYLILHNSGLHQVCLPSVSADAEELLHKDADLACTVEHLICTRPTGDSRPAPLLGATVSYPPATVISLRANHRLHTLKAKPNLRQEQVLSSQELDPAEEEDLARTNLDNIETRIRSIFQRSCTQPQILSANDTVTSPAQTLHILSTATETLQNEYVNKIIKAQAELAAEVKMLRAKKANQEAQLAKLEQSRSQLRANAENISERYEDIRDRGSSLAARVEAVLTRLQTHVPGASHAELKMARDLKVLQAKMEQVKVATEQLKEKEKYQRYQLDQVTKSMQRCSLNLDQTENIKAVLQGDSSVITDLVKSISSAKKDVTL